MDPVANSNSYQIDFWEEKSQEKKFYMMWHPICLSHVHVTNTVYIGFQKANPVFTVSIPFWITFLKFLTDQGTAGLAYAYIFTNCWFLALG